MLHNLGHDLQELRNIIDDIESDEGFRVGLNQAEIVAPETVNRVTQLLVQSIPAPTGADVVIGEHIDQRRSGLRSLLRGYDRQ